MRRACVCAVLALLAAAGQLMVVDRLSLPGGSVPDLALVIVVALGLTRGPVTGMLTGFFAGLGLDLAPPANHLIGESALVLCLVGYGCGRLSGWPNRSAGRMLLVAVLATATGEALQATIGLIVGDPGVTTAAVRHVLPGAVLYDVLLTTAVLSLVMLVGRRHAARLANADTQVRRPAFRRASVTPRKPRPGFRATATRLHIGISRRPSPRTGASSPRLPVRPAHFRLRTHAWTRRQEPRSSLRRPGVRRGRSGPQWRLW